MDVARVSGVSYATVSRFLNGNPHVSPEAAERIAAAVRDIHYIPNNAARSLVRQRTQTVAFVMHGEPESITTDPNINTIMVNANRRLSDAGYQLVVLIADSDEAGERIARLVRSGFADGWILNNLQVDDPLFTVFRSVDAPVAVSGAGYGESSPFPTVDIDNREASAELTRYLLGKDHRHIAYICGPEFIPCASERLHGFQEAMGDNFDPTLVVQAEDWGRASGQKALLELLQRLAGASSDTAPNVPAVLKQQHIDALVCGNDCLAAGAMQYLIAHGVRIPEDVAVAGFDDSPDAQATNPPLTTVHQPIGQFGVQMADMVLNQLEGDEAPSIVWLPTHVVVRHSA
ncbi:periplasmic-binding protein/LacI transcriptional regulator [Bifidobacterium goeldii]|uniref:Periplasmic-binding protein/LacI transcriptional regulator n=1 Tax=Bifidobacterium goeldii TaxID=2306975 RepID=A0A430FNB1_9BIFI|nr:LacI family DNA-binding transcriptional regulator [Bifidobacterium goeldii]RSX54304.1 periplasmic-binding protein/LacI transcriptional regulator [Bifidobacterium goeldii]